MKNNEMSKDDFLGKLEQQCHVFGYRYENKFDYIYIQTRLEAWKFEYSSGKIKLLHRNSRGSNPDGYHTQWRDYTTVENLIDLFKRHEDSKYRK